MDCNKDEAARAMQLAEEKMCAADFVGAHKLVTTAQRLFPDLENIPKMITICDVHSSAEKKIKGLDNWYGVLQVQPFADADTIKKQYRKLALLLHPDKNKFAGAEAAFKLVVEANRWLSDRIKRSQYDVRYRSHSMLARKQSNAKSGRHCSAANNAPENIASGHAFWTCCKNCGYRYKYLKPYVNKVMHCSFCQNSYTACNMECDGMLHNSSTAAVKKFQDQEMHNTSRQNASTGAKSGSSAAEMDKDRTIGGKLNKRNQGKQKRGTGERKPREDEGCTENNGEGGKPQKSETVINSSAEIPKPDVLKPQPEVQEPEASAAAEIDKNGTVRRKLNKRNQQNLQRGAGDRKLNKDEGPTENDAGEGRSQKGAEISKPDLFELQPEVKEQEHSAADEMDKNGTVRRKLNKRNQGNQKRGSGDRKLKKDEGCTENNAEGIRPQKGAEISKPDILKPRPEVKGPEAGAAKLMPDLSSPKKNQAAKKRRKSSISFEVDGSDVAGDKNGTSEYNKRKSPRKKPQVSYGEWRRGGDFVIPPTKKTKSGCGFESDFNTKQTDEDNKSPGLADSGVFPASSHTNRLDLPDPEFNVFEDERKPESFAVNQVWSTCDPRDGMPRRYAWVKKVLASDFKLQITYLEPIRESNDKSILIAWGKFKNGETTEVESRSIFSSQMLHSSCNRVVSIYPRKGEIWALFRDWNQEWNTALEKHKLPFKYDFVEIVNDFKQEDGIGVAYLGKLKGFVSIFHREAHNGVLQIQLTVEDMLRFSHKVPAVKLTGKEKDCVPVDSYELDPTALPKYIFQVDPVNMEIDSETLKGKADGSYPEAPKMKMKGKAKPVPEIAPSPRKRQKSNDDGGCSNHDKVCSTSVSLGEVIGGSSRTNDFSSCQVNGKSRSNKSRKSGDASDAFKLRKSPRLQTNPSQKGDEKKSAKRSDTIDTPKRTDKGLVTDSLGTKKSSKVVQQRVESQVGEGSKRRRDNGELPSLLKQDDLPTQLDGSTKESLEKTPVSSSCRTPQRNAFDFKNQRSEDKFQVNQMWAIYSNDKGMPTEYVKIKKIQTKPEFVLHVTHMELYPPSTEPVTRPVSCGDFKLETGKPKILPRASFSHQVKPIDSRKKIVKVYPRKGEIWALHKNGDSTEEEHDIVEVVKDYCEGDSVKAVALTARGFSSLYIIQRKHGSNAGLLDIPKAEMSRFSHRVPAVKHEKRTTRLVEGVYWELDPVAIPGRTIVLD